MSRRVMANNSPSSKYNRRGAGQWPFVILRRGIAWRRAICSRSHDGACPKGRVSGGSGDQRRPLGPADRAAREPEHLQDERDRSLAAEIVTGTLRWQRSLDHLDRALLEASASTDSMPKSSPSCASVSIRLLHLDRVPASAVVDDAVDLTRGARKPSASGFVNAVLRSTLRQRHKLPLPARPTNVNDRASALAYLGITHSHPDWLVSRWLERYGFEATERWVQFNNATPLADAAREPPAGDA